MSENIIDFLKPIIPSIVKFEHRILNNTEKSSLYNIHNCYSNRENEIFPCKKELRKQFLELRNSFPEDYIKLLSDLLTDKIIESEEFKKSSSIFIYLSAGSEFNTAGVIDCALKSGKSVCVPYIKNKTMFLSRITESTVYKTGYLNIREPEVLDRREISFVNFAVVPGLVFNSLGYRIGYGGGYYDKFLSEFNGFSVGTVFPGFLRNDFIPESFDMPVDRLFYC